MAGKRICFLLSASWLLAHRQVFSEPRTQITRRESVRHAMIWATPFDIPVRTIKLAHEMKSGNTPALYGIAQTEGGIQPSFVESRTAIAQVKTSTHSASPYALTKRFYLQAKTHGLNHNRLLAALPPKSRQRLIDAGDQIELISAEVLVEPGECFREVYFPDNCSIALSIACHAGNQLGVGLIGNEGMLGTPLVLGIERSPAQAIVQGAGAALRINAALFRQALGQDPVLAQTLCRYIHVLMQQLAQTAICAHAHVAEARLARWLLMTQDRAQADTFHVTHAFLACMLGIRRVGITKAAGSLQKRHLISYNRGNIIIENRPELINAACECYKADSQHYDDHMGF